MKSDAMYIIEAEHIDHRQRPQLGAAAELVVDEVQAPDLVRACRHAARLTQQNHFMQKQIGSVQAEIFRAERCTFPKFNPD